MIKHLIFLIIFLSTYSSVKYTVYRQVSDYRRFNVEYDNMDLKSIIRKLKKVDIDKILLRI